MNFGPLDCTYHYYYDGQSVVEERNGSDTAIKQYVWGLNYIDEFVQIAVNHDLWNNPQMVDPHPWGVNPWSEPLSVKKYYALHDANYNVLVMVDHAGNLAERYEYTPYGERQVYTSSGLNDPACMTPTLLSQRQNMYIWTLGDPEELIAFPQPYGLNNIGHQGLMHDEELSPKHIENRARYRTHRFLQRDPLGYPDGMNAYAYYAGTMGGLDPRGTDWIYTTPDGQQIVIQDDHFATPLPDKLNGRFYIPRKNRPAEFGPRIELSECQSGRPDRSSTSASYFPNIPFAWWEQLRGRGGATWVFNGHDRDVDLIKNGFNISSIRERLRLSLDGACDDGSCPPCLNGSQSVRIDQAAELFVAQSAISVMQSIFTIGGNYEPESLLGSFVVRFWALEMDCENKRAHVQFEVHDFLSDDSAYRALGRGAGSAIKPSPPNPTTEIYLQWDEELDF